MPFAPLSLKPSWRLASFLILLHMFALFIIANLDVNLISLILLTVLLTASCVYSLHQHILMLSSRSIIAIGCDANNRWILMQRNGDVLLSELLKSSVMTKWVCILHFKCQRRRVNVLLPYDALSSKDYRYLRQVFYST
jgi:hypothetical protein